MVALRVNVSDVVAEDGHILSACARQSFLPAHRAHVHAALVEDELGEGLLATSASFQRRNAWPCKSSVCAPQSRITMAARALSLSLVSATCLAHLQAGIETAINRWWLCYGSDDYAGRV